MPSFFRQLDPRAAPSVPRNKRAGSAAGGAVSWGFASCAVTLIRSAGGRTKIGEETIDHGPSYVLPASERPDLITTDRIRRAGTPFSPKAFGGGGVWVPSSGKHRLGIRRRRHQIADETLSG